MMSQKTRVALITGSSRGIGRAIALRLAGDGFVVVVNYVNRRKEGESLVERINAGGGQAVAVQGSVALAQDRTRLVDAAYEKWGRLDLLVNNAGITSPGRDDLLDAREENWDLVMATNLKGPFFLAQSVARRMIAQIRQGAIAGGQIINISSISSYAGSTNRADYCIAKAGMRMMTGLLASRLADEGINVYEVCPGVIASDMTAPVQETYDRLIAEGLSPIRRWGQPEDVAQAVSAIAAGYFPFSTGERINVDGGFHIRRL
jgi:NAD(P)-dependent dehydrogenase (short-subunit alcohol dehydrogenase family)